MRSLSEGTAFLFYFGESDIAERHYYREMLDSLQDQVQSLEQGSRNMVNQVRVCRRTRKDTGC